MLQRLYAPLEIKAVDTAQRTIDGYAAIFGNLDRNGDIIEPGAFKRTLTENPDISVFIGHDMGSLPVGEPILVREDPKGLFTRTKIYETADGNDFLTIAAARHAQGKPLGMSIGYRTKTADKALVDGEYVRKLLDLDLVEYSYLASPLLVANPEAITTGIKALLEATDVEMLLAAQTFDEFKAVLSRLETKRAIGVHHTDTSDASWDGPANEARIPNDAKASTLRKAFAWIDPEGDANTKTAYKFIHHEVSADGAVGAANVKAAQTGIGVLNGGRGGTTIPDTDRQGVYNHLAAHIKDAGGEPPELKSLAPHSHALRRLGRKETVVANTDDSYEDLIDDLQEAAAEALGTWCLVIATFPDHVVITSWDREHDDQVYYDIPYTLDTLGEPVMGEPVLVDMAFVLSTEPEEAMAAASRMSTAASWFERKAGQRLGKEQRDALQAIADGIRALQDWANYDEDGKGKDDDGNHTDPDRARKVREMEAAISAIRL